MGWFDFSDVVKRRKVVAVLSWFFPFSWAAAFLFIKLPVLMVLSGGIIGSILLFVVVFAALYFKYRKTYFMPSGFLYQIAFWISIVSIVGVGVYGLWKVIA
jgi:manganese transport protein